MELDTRLYQTTIIKCICRDGRLLTLKTGSMERLVITSVDGTPLYVLDRKGRSEIKIEKE